MNFIYYCILLYIISFYIIRQNKILFVSVTRFIIYLYILQKKETRKQKETIETM